MLLPARIHGQVDEAKVEKNILKLSQYLDVQHCLEKYPYQLSGGEQQRVNVIRALSLKPKLILCDEPTGNLDSKNSQKVASLIYDLAQEFSSTLLVVTHDKAVAGHFKREVIMEDGILRNN
jgi:ABC-type lipoprotein export system ATPase subunit